MEKQLLTFFKEFEKVKNDIQFTMATIHGIQFHLYHKNKEVINGLEIGENSIYVTYYVSRIMKDAYYIQENNYINGTTGYGVIYSLNEFEKLKKDILEYFCETSDVQKTVKKELETCSKIYESTKLIKDKDKQFRVIQRMLNIEEDFEEIPHVSEEWI